MKNYSLEQTMTSIGSPWIKQINLTPPLIPLVLIKTSTCYRGSPQSKVYKLIKLELFKTRDKTNNEFSGSDKLKEILDDLLGKDSHASHEKLPHDYWAMAEDRANLIRFLLVGFSSLSEEMLDLLLKYMVMNSSRPTYMEELQEAMVKTKFVSSSILVNLVKWMLRDKRNAYYGYPSKAPPICLLFNHPKFPVEALLEYCQSPNPEVRQLASLSPNCPTEGRVVVALLKEGA